MRSWPRPVRLAVVLLAIAAVAGLARLFPWAEAGRAVASADPRYLVAAALLNLAAHSVRGGAWHRLMEPRAPHRLRSALLATLAGEAVSCVSIAVGGEAVRATLVSRRDGVPFRIGAESIAASRIMEGVALVGFIALSTPFLPTTPAVITLRYGAWAAIALIALLALTRLGPRLFALLPARVRSLVGPMFGSEVPIPLGPPLALGLLNWLLEWATFHVCIVAMCGPVPYVASLLALIAANVGGLFRLTPGNAGVLQASVAAALLPMGIAPSNALAAGLVLQAAQSLPVMCVGFMAGGGIAWQALRANRTGAAAQV